MHFKITLNLAHSSFQELNEIQRQMHLAITRFETKYRCLESREWHLIIVDQEMSDLFSRLEEHDRVIFISERVETVPPRVIVSVREDFYECVEDALTELFLMN
jgi:hypothetical protein